MRTHRQERKDLLHASLLDQQVTKLDTVASNVGTTSLTVLINSIFIIFFECRTHRAKRVRAVDFSKSSVVAIFQGTVNTGGHSVVITSIKNNEAGAL